MTAAVLRSLSVAAPLVLVIACQVSPEPAAMPSQEDGSHAVTRARPTDVAQDTPQRTAMREKSDTDGPPKMPVQASEQTEAGAEAFVRYYVASLDRAYATGSAQGMPELASPDCDSCVVLLEEIPSNPEAESTFALRHVQAMMIGDELARVETRVEVLRGPGMGEGGLVFDLERGGEGWLVDSIRVSDEP